MISPISLGALVSLLLTAAHARALPQVPQGQTPQVQTPSVQAQQIQAQNPVQTPQAQAQTPVQDLPFASLTAQVFSAMRNNPSDPAGVLISLPFQTTTVTVTAPASTVTVSGLCFSAVATPLATPVASQPGNGLIGAPSTPVVNPPVAIPTPTSVAPGVFPPGFPTTAGLLPFLPSGTGNPNIPLATGGFISAVLPIIESSVALEIKSLLNPLVPQPTSPVLQTPPVQNPPAVQTQAIAQTPAVIQSPPAVQTPAAIPTQPVAQQITIATPTTVSVSVPTTIVNTVIDTVQVTNTVQQVATVTLSQQPTTVTLPATNTPAAFTSPTVAPFPFPSGAISSSGIFATGTGIFPTGAFPVGTAVTPQNTPVASPIVPQGTPVASPPLPLDTSVPTPASVPQVSPVVSPVASPIATTPDSGTTGQRSTHLSALPGTTFGQAGQGQGTINRRHARDFVAHHMINA